MSYSSENTLSPGTRIRDVRELVSLLDYTKLGVLKSEDNDRFEEYEWFDATDYHSWTGIGLSVSQNDENRVLVSTETTVGRSYFDLVHQNRTISALRKHFGGEFVTDEGRGRFLRPSFGPPPPPASGCYLAHSRFGENLIKANTYLMAREFPKHPPRISSKGNEFLLSTDPRLLANNMLIPFLVAGLEDYFKSTFIALLRYSPQKEAFFSGVRLQGRQMSLISDGKSTIEQQVSELLPFQRISAIFEHFRKLDRKLDIEGALRKPYHRRSKSLFDTLDELVTKRHNFIHRTKLDSTMTDERLNGLIYDLEVAITRVYRRITDHYGWFFSQSWFLGRRPPTKKTVKSPQPVARIRSVTKDSE